MTDAPARAPRPLLAQRDFAPLWWGQLISILGDRLHYFALQGLLLAHTRQFADATQSSVLLAVFGTVMLMPVLLFAPFAGPWVDRWNLKHTVVISDAIRAGLVALIPISYAATHHIGVVFAIVFLMFTCNVFFLPAKSAMTPEIVPPDQLLAANTLLSVAGIAATAIGAAVGGWVVDHWGWTTALWFDTASYVVSVATLAAIRYRPRARELAEEVTPQGYLGQIGEGLSIVRKTPAVSLALIALGAVWIGGGFLQVAGNQHIQRAASIPGVERTAMLMATLAVGAALGTWWVNTHGKRFPRPLLLGVGLLLSGGFMIAFAVTTRFAVFAISGFLVGFCIAPTFVLTETLLQESTDLRQRGRIFSLRDFTMRLLFQISIWIAAVFTPLAGTAVALLIAAALIAGAGALSIAWGRRTLALMHVAGRE